MSFAEVARSARGRWAEILPALGVPAESLSAKHGPCPGCGGRDRFRYDDKGSCGTWICGQGGSPVAGDGFDLLQHVLGLTKAKVLRMVSEYLAMDPNPRAAALAAEARRQHEREEIEAAVWHEILILNDLLGARVTERQLAKDRRFREARPGWRPFPPGPWQREKLAARRLKAGLGRLYP